MSMMLPAESVARLACLCLFDYESAFPSLGHEWIFLVLSVIGAPEGFVNVQKGLYKNAAAYSQVEGRLKFLFMVLSGALTGCPMSGALLNFAIDPLLWRFSQLVFVPAVPTENLFDFCRVGRILACADDIAAAMREMASLIDIFRIFKRFQAVSGLCLHPGKCILILTSVVATADVVGVVRQWLATNIPEWRDMVISNVGTYLGVALGPLAKILFG